MEDIIVHLVVSGAVLFLAWWIYRNLIAQKKRVACGGCNSCPTQPEDQPDGQSNVTAPSADPPR